MENDLMTVGSNSYENIQQNSEKLNLGRIFTDTKCSFTASLTPVMKDLLLFLSIFYFIFFCGFQFNTYLEFYC